MGRRAKLTKEEVNQKTIHTAKEHFARNGFYGARIEAIANDAELNKRMIYEFSHKKEGLYLAVLSDVSRGVWAKVEKALPEHLEVASLRELCAIVFEVILDSEAFLRLLMWERMMETINGARILEAANAIFERLEGIFQKSLGHRYRNLEKYKMLCSSVALFVHTTALMLTLHREAHPESFNDAVSQFHLQAALAHIDALEKAAIAEMDKELSVLPRV